MRLKAQYLEITFPRMGCVESSPQKDSADTKKVFANWIFLGLSPARSKRSPFTPGLKKKVLSKSRPEKNVLTHTRLGPKKMFRLKPSASTIGKMLIPKN